VKRNELAMKISKNCILGLMDFVSKRVIGNYSLTMKKYILMISALFIFIVTACSSFSSSTPPEMPFEEKVAKEIEALTAEGYRIKGYDLELIKVDEPTSVNLSTNQMSPQKIIILFDGLQLDVSRKVRGVYTSIHPTLHRGKMVLSDKDFSTKVSTRFQLMLKANTSDKALHKVVFISVGT